MSLPEQSMEPREGYGAGPFVGRSVVSGGRERIPGVIVGQAGPWIDVRWGDGRSTFSDSRLFSGLVEGGSDES